MTIRELRQEDAHVFGRMFKGGMKEDAARVVIETFIHVSLRNPVFIVKIIAGFSLFGYAVTIFENFMYDNHVS